MSFDLNKQWEKEIITNVLEEHQRIERLYQLYNETTISIIIKELVAIGKELTTNQKESEVIDNSFRIQAYCKALESKMAIFTEYVRNFLVAISDKMPQNPYNIKNCLNYASDLLDWDYPENIDRAIFELNKDSFRGIYNAIDLKNAEDKGYDVGYNTCLKAQKLRSVTNSMRNIDFTK